jgi:hypothetical protein
MRGYHERMSTITLIEERVGQLHFLKELLRRVSIDV